MQPVIDKLCPPGAVRAPDFLLELIILIVWAGHETTTGQISWVLADLLQNPDYLQRVRSEIDSFVGTGEINMFHLKQMPVLRNAIRESTRLHPIAIFIPRFASKDIAFGPYKVPAGTPVFSSVLETHRLHEVFADPNRYDPDRFASPRNEGANTIEELGFGSGKHRCLGENFANLEMMTILAALFQTYDVSRTEDTIEPNGHSGPNWPAEFKVRAVPRR